MAELRVVVVGAGPAGSCAAETLVAAGLRPVVIDEGRRDGGQIYRRQPENFTRALTALYGTEASRAVNLHESFDSLRPHIDYRPETLAWNIAERRLYTIEGMRNAVVPFGALIIAAGATDRLMPVRGWELAGTYSLGAAQIALKFQACSIGRRVVFLGTGPLLYLVAAQYLKAGAAVAAVLDTSRAALRFKALPKLAIRADVLLKGAALVAAIRRAGVPLATGVTPIEICGDGERGVSAVVFRDRIGAERRVDCDAVGLGYHLRPETQLADLARCNFVFDSETRHWLPELDEDGRSSVDGVYLAGDGARVLGADAAELAGRLAALAVLADAGLPARPDEMARLRRGVARMNRFRKGLAQAFPWPAAAAASLPDDAIACRCEMISVGELRSLVRDKGTREINRAKALGRCGMGRCQGRYCGDAAAEILAAAAGIPLEAVGRLRCQAPIKPLPVATATVEA